MMPRKGGRRAAYQCGLEKGRECLAHFEGNVDRAVFARLCNQEAEYAGYTDPRSTAKYQRGWMESAPHEEDCGCGDCLLSRADAEAAAAGLLLSKNKAYQRGRSLGALDSAKWPRSSVPVFAYIGRQEAAAYTNEASRAEFLRGWMEFAPQCDCPVCKDGAQGDCARFADFMPH